MSFFGKTGMKYLEFLVARKGTRPVNKKVYSIVNTPSPTKNKNIRLFIVLFNYYWNIWTKRPHILQPLTNVTPSKINLKWKGIGKFYLMKSSGFYSITNYEPIHTLINILIFIPMKKFPIWVVINHQGSTILLWSF